MTDPGSAQPRRRGRQAAPAHKSGQQPAPPRKAGQQATPAGQQSGRRQSRDSGERGLRDLVGGGSSQLGLQRALRGRDVNRPTDEELAAAERDVVIVRRNWKPPSA